MVAIALAFLSAVLWLRCVIAWQQECENFVLPANISTTLTTATYYAPGDLVNVTSSGGAVHASNLPAFCRLQLVIHTTSNSSALTEVWLPDAWDGRFLFVGNGGWSGGVVYGDLAYAGIVNGHAAVSTDGGHESSSLDGSWALNNPEAIIDYAYRAVHMSVLSAKTIVQSYYSTPTFYSYWLGCSTGGRQGLMEVQRYPEDFDGVVVGSPANWISHLQAWSIHIDLQVLPVNSSQWISPATWSVIHQEVLNQCDALDGVVDGILNDPRTCFFRPEAIACRPSQDPSTCLNLAQINALSKIYTAYYETNQTYIFGGYYPGGELGYAEGLVGAEPNPLNTGYFEYMVLNDSTWDPTTLNFSTIQLADEVDTYRLDAVNPNITAFVGAPKNGKILQYVGWADQLISPGNSLYWYEQVYGYMQYKTNLVFDDFYRLFTVPGMQHCAGGAGANAFGGEGQASAGAPPLQPDALHDVLRAMIVWVENGVAPTKIVATKYVNDNATQGVEFTRPLCMFPQEIVYNGYGNTNEASSFYCA